MKRFTHIHAASLECALRSLGREGAHAIAGGTDLLTLMKGGILTPASLVNLKTIPALDTIRFDGAGGLTVGALATLSAVSRDETVRAKYPVLSTAISAAATPQLRNMGTVGGNLLQHPRCWYYRGPFPCWLKGGDTCFAREGENAHHALFGGGPCYAVHPSDPAVALVALGAEARVLGKKGERTMPIEGIFQRPRQSARGMSSLRSSEIIVEVRSPPPAEGSRGVYLKAMERRTWGFALASVAIQLATRGPIVRQARVVLGGVAPKPWRATDAEDALLGHALEEERVGRAAELALSGAHPLGRNRYKIALARGLIRQALERLEKENDE